MYSTEIVYLKRVITKLFYFGVQTLGGEGGVKKSSDRIHTFIFFFNDDLPNTSDSVQGDKASSA